MIAQAVAVFQKQQAALIDHVGLDARRRIARVVLRCQVLASLAQ